MLTQALRKQIKSLHQKKFRRETGCFLVEGGKSVCEALRAGFSVSQVFCTPEFLPELAGLCGDAQVFVISARELTDLGTLENNHTALAIAHIPTTEALAAREGEWLLALDGLRDPGNLGTILRTADWFGIQQIFCSEDCAEWTSPKVLSASMGSFTRVRLQYGDLPGFLVEQKAKALPLLGMDLQGENLHQHRFEKRGGVIVVGSESHGLSEAVSAHLTTRITIPRFGLAESLNAAIATAIVLDALRR